MEKFVLTLKKIGLTVVLSLSFFISSFSQHHQESVSDSILVFIFILAAFNLIASITMLFVEKKEDIHILKSMGADGKLIFRIFFYEGLLIAAKGIVFGLILGYGVCFLQLQFGLLEMPNSFGEVFPIMLTVKDGLLILFLVSSLSFLASYFPVKMLLKRNAIV